jgi:hypothetical protein
MSSHGHSGAGLTKPSLDALTSKHKGNCNAKHVLEIAVANGWIREFSVGQVLQKA